MRTIFAYSIALVFLFAASSCTKENRNERRLAGVWQLEKITTETFENNVSVSSTDTTIDAVIQLLNTDGIENPAYFEGFQPFPTDYCNWDIAYKNPKLIKFYLINVELGIIYTYYYNIEKLNSKKMILSRYNADQELNILEKTTWHLKKER